MKGMTIDVIPGNVKKLGPLHRLISEPELAAVKENDSIFDHHSNHSKIAITAIAFFKAIERTIEGIPQVLASPWVQDKERRDQMERMTWTKLSKASNIFYKIFRAKDFVACPMVGDRMAYTLAHRGVRTRLGFALSTVAMLVARLSDAILGVVLEVASLLTLRQINQINRIADSAFFSWPKIVTDVLFCVLRIIHPDSGINPLVQV